MNHDEILQAAKDVIGGYGIDEENNTVGPFLYFELERFAAIIEKRTIERCAVTADEIGDTDNGFGCAAAIRKLGEQE